MESCAQMTRSNRSLLALLFLLTVLAGHGRLIALPMSEAALCDRRVLGGFSKVLDRRVLQVLEHFNSVRRRFMKALV